MPTYEYQCTRCGSVFDVFQSIKAAPLRTSHCQTCAAERPVKRLIGTGGGVIFKGSGFYQTDYRSESYKKAAEAEKKPADKPDGESSKSADSGATTAKSEAKPKASPAKPTGGKNKPKKDDKG